jgi:hypothetical protein
MKLSEAKRGTRVIVDMGFGRGPTRRGIIRRVHKPDAIHPSGNIVVYVPHWQGEPLLGNFRPDDVQPVDAPEEAPE